MINSQKQLNPFELKSVLCELLASVSSPNDIQKYLDKFELLLSQENKSIIGKLLFKELSGAESNKIPVICFMLESFLSKEDLISGLWEVLKNKSLKTDVRVMVLNILRETDADWSYESCEEYIDDAGEILDESTKQLLNTAVINPEVQIDFMDFLYSINTDDKIILLNSFGKDFESDALANILVPVFESNPMSAQGQEALKLLAGTKSVLALNVLERMAKNTTGELNKNIRKNLALLKMSGIRVDNSAKVYKQAMADSKPDKFYLTYPDARGDSAMIFTRLTKDERIRFVSIVVNIETGIKDCFGFFDISKFESDKILEKFLNNEKVVSVPPECFKNILYKAELQTFKKYKNERILPYEYVCWKTLLIDVENEEEDIEQILKDNLKPISLDSFVISELERMKISHHWFLDYDYSDEFQNLIKELKTENDLDLLIKNNLSKVFTLEENIAWKSKLLYCAYVKFAIGKKEEASEIYSIIFDDNIFSLLKEEVLKRSIYEYLVMIRYNKDENKEMFTDEDISNKIGYVEKNWVNTNV